MIIKAGGIQNLTDARYFSSWLVKWIGFCFDENAPNFIQPREAQQIKAWLEGPKFVGEFGNQSIKEIQEIAMILGLHGVQVNINEANIAVLELKLPIIAKLEVKPHLLFDFHLIDTFAKCSEYLLIDLVTGYDSWETFVNQSPDMLKQAIQLSQQYPVMLATNFSPSNIQHILSTINPIAIELTGSGEQKTGEKVFDNLEEVMNLLQLEG